MESWDALFIPPGLFLTKSILLGKGNRSNNHKGPVGLVFRQD